VTSSVTCRDKRGRSVTRLRVRSVGVLTVGGYGRIWSESAGLEWWNSGRLWSAVANEERHRFDFRHAVEPKRRRRCLCRRSKGVAVTSPLPQNRYIVTTSVKWDRNWGRTRYPLQPVTFIRPAARPEFASVLRSLCSLLGPDVVEYLPPHVTSALVPSTSLDTPPVAVRFFLN